VKVAISKKVYEEIVALVSCQACLAHKGQPCRSGSGKVATAPHADRIKAAEEVKSNEVDLELTFPRSTPLADEALASMARAEEVANRISRGHQQFLTARENRIAGVLMGIRLIKNALRETRYGLTDEDVQDAVDRRLAEIIVDDDIKRMEVPSE
jgi:hypothetical protein